ncbi:MAG: hypothetical protein C4516_09000 [Oxalobacter sp.]|nr:MAG: hypothetical protein C4516_09000 [Oxalobacter sp.]
MTKTVFTTDANIKFLPFPDVRSTEMSLTNVSENWPTFDKLLRELSGIRVNPNLPVGVVGYKSLLGGCDELHASGKALVLLLPDELTPYLEALAVQKPHICNIHSIDLLQSETVCEWSINLIGGKFGKLQVPESAMCKAMNSGCGFQGKTDSFVHMVFIAGNQIVSAGFWMDAVDVMSMQAATASSGINYRPYRIWDDTELTYAAIRAKNAGSPTPWKTGVWDDSTHNRIYYADTFCLDESN